ILGEHECPFFHLGLGEHSRLLLIWDAAAQRRGFTRFHPSTPHHGGCSLVLSQTSQRELRPLRTSSGLSAAVDSRRATGPLPQGGVSTLAGEEALSLATCGVAAWPWRGVSAWRASWRHRLAMG